MWEASPTPMGQTMQTSPYIRGRTADLRKGRISEDFGCYSITKNVNFRKPVLANDRAAKILTESWQFLRKRNRIKLLAFCILPDHFHLLLSLMRGEMLSKVMEDTGRFTSRELNKLLCQRGQFWQEGFHDHHCRNDEELHELGLYIEQNPVRRQIVELAEEWPHSSAHAANKWMLDREWWP